MLAVLVVFFLLLRHGAGQGLLPGLASCHCAVVWCVEREVTCV